MKTKDQLDEEMINLMERFDFEKCVAYMTIKGWKVNNSIPTETQMRQWALEKLEKVIELYLADNDLHILSNEQTGLYARIGNAGDLKLGFFIEQKTSYPI